MHVKEWLHQSAKRPVKVRFGPETAFHLLNRKGEKLRSVFNSKNKSRVCREIFFGGEGLELELPFPDP